MPSFIQTEIAAGNALPVTLTGGKVRNGGDIFTLASDATGTYSIGKERPRGSRLIALRYNLSVSLGSSTIALGITGAVEKYRVAATSTTANSWVEMALNASLLDEITAAEQLLMTVAAAALPASGRILFAWQWSDPS